MTQETHESVQKLVATLSRLESPDSVEETLARWLLSDLSGLKGYTMSKHRADDVQTVARFLRAFDLMLREVYHPKEET